MLLLCTNSSSDTTYSTSKTTLVGRSKMIVVAQDGPSGRRYTCTVLLKTPFLTNNRAVWLYLREK